MFNNFKNILRKNKSSFILDFNNFKFANDVCYSRCEKHNVLELKEELLDNSKQTQEIFSIYWNVYKQKNKLFMDSALIKTNIFVLNPGKIGREYNKTFAYKTMYKDEEKNALFKILNGEGYFILENQAKIKDIKIIKVKPKDYIYIPKGFIFTIINSSNENLVCLSLMGKNTRLMDGLLDKQNGMGIFYTDAGFVRNKNVEPTYILENFEGDYLEDLAFNKEKGLYKEFIELPEKFNFLK